MHEYLPVIIIAVIIAVALLWWLTARDSVSKDSSPSKVIDAPPVAPASTAKKTTKAEKVAVAPLMADPKPASKKAVPRPQAPLKAAATKSAPVKKAAPKAVATKPAPKPVAPAKATAPKITPKPRAPVKTAAVPKSAPAPILPDNLELLKGVGPKLNSLLKSLGVTSFEQVANWSAADVTEIDSKLGTFAGRISRDNWIDQAKLLADGDIAGFEKKYGALGGDVQKG